MDYAVTTLEIEIARLERAIRKSESVTLKDSRASRSPDTVELRRQIKELQKAKEVLLKWARENPAEVDAINSKFGFLADEA